MALTTFYKRPSSEYNSTTYGTSIFSCSDTGEAYLFGSKIKIKWEDVINPPTIGSAVAWDDITGKPSWIDSSTKPSYNWSEIGGKPSTFTPSAHTHTSSQITDLQDKLDEYYPKTGMGYLSFDPSGRPVMDNNQGYSFKRADGTLLEALFVSPANELIIGGTSSNYVNNIKLNCTNLVSKSGATYLNTDNVGSIKFTGAVSATFDGTNDLTINIPQGGGEADSVDWSNVTNKPSWIGSSKPSYSWSEISSKPSTFTPSAHTHDFDEINFGNPGSNTQYLAGNGNFYTIAYSEISGTPDLSSYATKSYVEEVVGQGGSVDLSNYVTLDGTQTITGTKTFTQYIVFSNGAGTSSDVRLKKNIQALPIEEALKVLELQGMKYHFIPTDKNTTGLIAQEVEKVIPEAVITAEDGLKSVDTYPIIAYMIEVIKDLRKEVEDLKRKIQLT